MKRFFFDVRFNGHQHMDKLGVECSSEQAAELEGTKMIVDLARSAGARGQLITIKLLIRNETGAAISSSDLTVQRTWNTN